ncbi:unnamed protein product [Mesocestoides corti]|uniref:Guanylate cyclase domain-containing protein n=1 Tax=Mesocestoides corti TaxID=53468 RepID=A0A0R3UQ20_MESCO|nr:unnamed protein product [Mesocestoides corti]
MQRTLAKLHDQRHVSQWISGPIQHIHGPPLRCALIDLKLGLHGTFNLTPRTQSIAICELTNSLFVKGSNASSLAQDDGSRDPGSGQTSVL